MTLARNSTIRVSWTPPEGPPSGGYCIIDEGNGRDRPASESPQEFMASPGQYNIQVLVVSQHFSGMAGPRTVIVLGNIATAKTLSSAHLIKYLSNIDHKNGVMSH